MCYNCDLELKKCCQCVYYYMRYLFSYENVRMRLKISKINACLFGKKKILHMKRGNVFSIAFLPNHQLTYIVSDIKEIVLFHK